MSDTVLYEVDPQGAALLTLSRPERRNMWTAQMETEFYDCLDRAAADTNVRVIVVTGAGSSFVPGLDPAVLASLTSGATYAANRRPQTFATTVPKPVIGAINGSCAGIGLAQALMFDYRFAVRGAKFSTAFAKRGLPAEDATAWILTRLAGPAHAFELLASGRVFLAEEAAELGPALALGNAQGDPEHPGGDHLHQGHEPAGVQHERHAEHLPRFQVGGGGAGEGDARNVL